MSSHGALDALTLLKPARCFEGVYRGVNSSAKLIFSRRFCFDSSRKMFVISIGDC